MTNILELLSTNEIMEALIIEWYTKHLEKAMKSIKNLRKDILLKGEPLTKILNFLSRIWFWSSLANATC